MNSLTDWERELALLENKSNLRKLPVIRHLGREVEVNGKVMLNLSSNDYLGLAAYLPLRTEFLQMLILPSSSSSRLLTGNFNIYVQIEDLLARLFRKESALVFNSGYHMNAGILPAVSDARTLILADKLVHASIIDGHNRHDQLEQLLVSNHAGYDRIIIVTESIFSMDGDEADLRRLVTLKQQYDNVLLYVDEAHAVGVRGMHGLGCAEEQDCVADIDFLCGTFGKALASVGGYIVCSKTIRDYLVNKMRTFIFTTALPPVNLLWTFFILEHLDSFSFRRERLKKISSLLKDALVKKGYACPSTSHILPMTIGDSGDTVLKADFLQRKGFYALPVRPPTVPEGTSRIRFSLTADITEEEIKSLIELI